MRKNPYKIPPGELIIWEKKKKKFVFSIEKEGAWKTCDLLVSVLLQSLRSQLDPFSTRAMVRGGV